MNQNWKDNFAPHILARGRRYFEENRIRRIQRCVDSYTAIVAGTEDYTVTIDIENGIPGYMECECPYAADFAHYCKHMATVLFALESGDVTIEEIPPAKKPPMISHVPVQTPWQEAIDKLPETVVRKELRKLGGRHERLRERLTVLYLGKLPEGQLQNWKADLQRIACGYTDRRGRILEEDSWEFLRDLGSFLDEKLPLLLEARAVMDAFYLLWTVMGTALEWEIEENYEELEDLFQDCRDAYEVLQSLATDAQKEQMQKWYQEHRNEDWPNGVEYMDHIFCTPVRMNFTDGKRIITYVGGIPCFLQEGEWVSFPERNGIFYDFAEETEAYKEAYPIIEERIKENLGELYGCFGSCHAIWYQRKQILLEEYGVEWFSPAELNRAVCFD